LARVSIGVIKQTTLIRVEIERQPMVVAREL
jgi:hypothetical protein